MAALNMNPLNPPHNDFGIPLPQAPGNPASLADITNARAYSDRLMSFKMAGRVPNDEVDSEIGAAEAYKTAVIFSHSPGGDVVPPWLANLNATVQQIAADVNQIRADVDHLRLRSDEHPIMMANSQVGPRGLLFNPTIIVNGWSPLLAPPNPRTRDELVGFTVAQCIASAANLGLPVMAAQTPVVERRRQIAVKIGVSID